MMSLLNFFSLTYFKIITLINLIKHYIFFLFDYLSLLVKYILVWSDYWSDYWSIVVYGGRKLVLFIYFSLRRSIFSYYTFKRYLPPQKYTYAYLYIIDL